jgi:hypothetical protein
MPDLTEEFELDGITYEYNRRVNDDEVYEWVIIRDLYDGMPLYESHGYTRNLFSVKTDLTTEEAKNDTGYIDDSHNHAFGSDAYREVYRKHDNRVSYMSESRNEPTPIPINSPQEQARHALSISRISGYDYLVIKRYARNSTT